MDTKINKLYEKMILKEGIGSDYILYQAIKKIFKLKQLNFAEFLIIKSSIQKIIKEKRIT